ILSHVRAFVDGDGPSGIRAGSISVTSADASGVFAVAGAASVGVAIGGNAGVAISIAASVAMNQVDGDTAAYIKNADGVSPTTGAVTVAATSSGRPASTVASAT